MHKFVIVPIDEINIEMLLACVQTPSKSALRKSLDGTKALLKFHGTPPELEGYKTYTREEVLTLLADPKWTDFNRTGIPGGKKPK